MESKVKASINLKEGIFQIEGPKEFVRNYLDHIIKNCIRTANSENRIVTLPQ